MLYTQGKTECAPADVGFDEKRLEILKNHFQRGIDEKQIQCGIFCLSRKGKIFAHGAIGKKSFREKDNTPVLPNSTRYIASVTKVFTAIAIMKLAEDGILNIEDKVGSILPQFDTPPYNEINLYHLLTHTSGMHADDGCFENKYQSGYWGIIDKAYKLHNAKKDGEFDWISAALGTIGSGLHAPIGSYWAYCSFGFVILGAVIEKLTGQKAEEYIEDNICKPLKMKDTAFGLTPKLAKRYIATDKWSDKYIKDTISGTYKPDWIGEKLGIPSTGGGLIGTAYDLVRFGNMLLSGGTLDGARVLGRKSVERMTSQSILKPTYCWENNGDIVDFGIGFNRCRRSMFTFSENTFWHEGAGACALYIDPAEEMVAVWITPFVSNDEWHKRIMFNTINVIWSGII